MAYLSRPKFFIIAMASIFLLAVAAWSFDHYMGWESRLMPAFTMPNTGSTVAKILSRGKLRVGVRQDAKPFGFVDDNGQTVGFDIDLARQLARRWLGSADALELVKVSPADRIPRLAAGEVDLLIAAMPNQRERDALIDFSQTYYVDGQSLLVRDDAAIKTIGDLQGKTVAALQDASVISVLQNEPTLQKLALTVQTFPDYATAIEALKAGKVDALAADSVTLSQLVQNDPGLRIAAGRLTSEPYNIGVPQGDSDLRDMVNFTLQDLKTDGTYAQLYQRWFPTDQPYALEISPGQWPYSFAKLPRTPTLPSSSRIETILKRGKLIAGIHTKFAPFSETAGTGERSGFDVDILHEFARRWLGDENAIEFVPGEPTDLVEQLSAGKLDVVAAALVQQRNWAAKIDFSQTYVGAPLASQPLSIGLPHNDNGFRELVNVTLQEMKTDGAYDTIYSRWFGKSSPQFALEIVPGDASYLLLPQQDQATTPRVTAATESTISRIRQRGNQLVVGIASNRPPFGQQDSQNQLVGFDPDLVQAMAKIWGLSLQMVPVTPANRIQKLVTGEVDMLAAAIPRSKDEEAKIDFSQTYFVNGQSLLTLQNSGLQTIQSLAGRTLAVLENSKAGDQIQAYADAKNVQILVQPYPTYEAALAALHANQVAAVIGDNVNLLQFAKADPGVSLVGDMFTYEPYGLGLPSGDSYFNNLVNITLQTLKQQGVYDELYHKWFGAAAVPYTIESFPGTWRYTFADSPTLLDKPVRSKVEEILTNRRLVAGVLYDLKPFGFLDANNQPEGFDVDMMREFAKRWLGDANAVVFVPVTAADRIQKLAAGEVDIVAASMTHKRERDESIDFSQTYFQDGQSLLVRADAGITSLGDLNGKTVAAIAGSASVENIQSAANQRAISINILPFQEYGQALQALKAGQVDAVTATRAALAQFAKDNPGLTVVSEQFTSEPYGLGIPNYDGRFQDLVNFTLQEMKADGTYDRLYHIWFGSDTPFALEVWPGQTYLDLDMIPMVYVPSGEYVRGNHTGFPDEKTEQLLHIDSFYMDETEVTNRQYAQCVQAGRCTSPRLPRSVNFSNYYAQSDFANFPAIWVAWTDAEAYCAYRGKRLPSEAEWEKAARGPQDTLYPWGNQDPTDQANYNYAARDVALVGSFPADRSGYGAYDMAGNVREWVADWYQWDYYPNAPTQNPTGPASGVTRVLRGGSWNDIALYLRSTARKNFLPDSFDSNLGFRCASSTFPPAQ